MIYSLIIVTAMSTQAVGTFDTFSDCKEAADHANKQGIKAICVQQESPAQIILKMQLLMKSFAEQNEKR